MIDVVTINGKQFRCVVRNGFSLTPNKLWDDETGRTYHNGSFKGRLIGVFPKWELTFFPKTPEELSSLMRELDKPHQRVTIYHPLIRKRGTFDTYSGDYTVQIQNMINGKAQHNRLDVSLIAKERQVI